MIRRWTIGACAALGLGLATAPAAAAILAFNGVATATAMVGADASCAPRPFRGIIAPGNTSGSSDLGSFTYSHNVCFLGATGPVTGVFELVFGTSSFGGLLDGVATARVGTPGLFDQFFTYTLTGGTGRFAGATGSFTNVGTVDVRGGPPSRLVLNFDGTIDAPAVPEPSSWVMMILGFGMVGMASRRRTTHDLAV